MLVGGNARPAARRRRADITIPRSAARRDPLSLLALSRAPSLVPRSALRRGTAEGNAGALGGGAAPPPARSAGRPDNL